MIILEDVVCGAVELFYIIQRGASVIYPTITDEQLSVFKENGCSYTSHSVVLLTCGSYFQVDLGRLPSAGLSMYAEYNGARC